jgi:hypothetical protein
LDRVRVAVGLYSGLGESVLFEPGSLPAPRERDVTGPVREPFANDEPGCRQERHELLSVALLRGEMFLFQYDLGEVAGIALVAGEIQEVGDVEGPVGIDEYARAESALILGQDQKRTTAQGSESDFFPLGKPDERVGAPPRFQDLPLEERRQEMDLVRPQLMAPLPLV